MKFQGQLLFITSIVNNNLFILCICICLNYDLFLTIYEIISNIMTYEMLSKFRKNR